MWNLESVQRENTAPSKLYYRSVVGVRVGWDVGKAELKVTWRPLLT